LSAIASFFLPYLDILAFSGFVILAGDGSFGGLPLFWSLNFFFASAFTSTFFFFSGLTQGLALLAFFLS
jgi:hypothetical protein